MLLVIPVSSKDLKLARLLVKRIEYLGGMKIRRVLLVLTKQAVADGAEDLVPTLESAFAGVDLLRLQTEDERGWPASSNHIFRNTAAHLDEIGNKESWYFMEADCFPMSAGWFDALIRDYELQRKPFMGCIHDTIAKSRSTGKSVVVGKHMVGTGIYPPDLWRRSLLLRFVNRIPWDIYIQHEVIPECAHTDLIQHNWSTFNYYRERGRILCEDLNLNRFEDNPSYAFPIKPEAVIVHGCKDDSLYDLFEPQPQRKAA